MDLRKRTHEREERRRARRDDSASSKRALELAPDELVRRAAGEATALSSALSSVGAVGRAGAMRYVQRVAGNAHAQRLVERVDDEDPLRGPVGPEGGVLDSQLAARVQARQGRGQPLGMARRSHLEGALGADLGDVRLHTDEEADALNRDLGARAFTLGSDIFFRRDASPNDADLLAHEATHVVQQRSMTGGGPLRVGPANDAYEREADRVATSVNSAGPEVQRQVEEEEELLQMQRQEEEEELLMLQRQEEEEEELLQMRIQRKGAGAGTTSREQGRG
jgi:hypothetical protein